MQAWLGHHAASFTMDTYVHLLPDDVGEAPECFDVIVPSDMATDEGETVAAQVAR